MTTPPKHNPQRNPQRTKLTPKQAQTPTEVVGTEALAIVSPDTVVSKLFIGHSHIYIYRRERESDIDKRV